MISTNALVYTLIILLLFEILILKIDFTAPLFIYTSSFVVCSVCTVFMGERWDISCVHIGTYILISVSIVIYILVDRITKMISFRKNVVIKTELKNDRIFKWIVIFNLILGTLCLFWGLKLIGKLYVDNWHETMKLYKDIVNGGLSEGGGVAQLGIEKKILNQFVKINEIMSYFLLYIYVGLRKEKIISKKMRLLYVISFIIYLIERFLISGSRQREIFFVVSWITGYYLLGIAGKTRKELKKDNISFVKKMVGFLLIIFPLFYYLGLAAGRAAKNYILDAAFGYLTTGIYGLEQLISSGTRSDFWGIVSFGGLFPFLKFIEIIPGDIKNMSFLPFFDHGNTVSILGRWYWDFGYCGTLIMNTLIAVFFSLIYYKGIKYNILEKYRNRYTLIYIYLIHILYFAGYDDFVSTLIGSYYPQIIVGMLMLNYIFIERKVKI